MTVVLSAHVRNEEEMKSRERKSGNEAALGQQCALSDEATKLSLSFRNPFLAFSSHSLHSGRWLQAELSHDIAWEKQEKFHLLPAGSAAPACLCGRK